MLNLTIFAAAAAAAAQPVALSASPVDLKAIEASCFDYLDGQLQGDPARVARALHPDLAKRAAIGETADEKFGLRRMTKEELVDLTRQGVLKTPEAQWDGSSPWLPLFSPCPKASRAKFCSNTLLPFAPAAKRLRPSRPGAQDAAGE